MSGNGLAPIETPATSAYDALKPVLQRFVDGVLAGETPTAVVRRLKPRLKRPDVLASKWLARPDVRAARAELTAENRAQLIERVGITQEMIARELGRIAFGDPRRLVNQDGTAKPLHELDEEATAMIAGFEVVETQVQDEGEKSVTTRVRKFKRWDKRQALRDLADMGGVKKGEDDSGNTIFNIQINL